MSHLSFRAQLLQVRTVEEAKRLLRQALAEGNREELVGGDYPFDIDLAGMLFPVNSGGRGPGEAETEESLSRLSALFADAVWEMCLEGLLRPGPYSPLDKTVQQSSGYCLTEKGRKSLVSETPQG